MRFEFASGTAFVGEGRDGLDARRPGVIVQCGGCMLTRREVLRRIGWAKEAGIPIVNYGMLLAAAGGLPVSRLLSNVLPAQKEVS